MVCIRNSHHNKCHSQKPHHKKRHKKLRLLTWCFSHRRFSDGVYFKDSFIMTFFMMAFITKIVCDGVFNDGVFWANLLIVLKMVCPAPEFFFHLESKTLGRLSPRPTKEGPTSPTRASEIWRVSNKSIMLRLPSNLQRSKFYIER